MTVCGSDMAQLHMQELIHQSQRKALEVAALDGRLADAIAAGKAKELEVMRQRARKTFQSAVADGRLWMAVAAVKEQEKAEALKEQTELDDLRQRLKAVFQTAVTDGRFLEAVAIVKEQTMAMELVRLRSKARFRAAAAIVKQQIQKKAKELEKICSPPPEKVVPVKPAATNTSRRPTRLYSRPRSAPQGAGDVPTPPKSPVELVLFHIGKLDAQCPASKASPKSRNSSRGPRCVSVPSSNDLPPVISPLRKSHGPAIRLDLGLPPRTSHHHHHLAGDACDHLEALSTNVSFHLARAARQACSESSLSKNGASLLPPIPDRKRCIFTRPIDSSALANGTSPTVGSSWHPRRRCLSESFLEVPHLPCTAFNDCR